DVKAAPESTRMVTEILDWLLPPRVIAVTGQLQPAGVRGVGISLELRDSQTARLLACYTLWQDEFDPMVPGTPDPKSPRPYFTLAEPAAVWAMFAYFDDRTKHGWWWQRRRKLRLSGTTDWQSYAFFRAGTNWVRDSNDDKARALYRRALTKDGQNLGTRINLASLEMKSKTADTGEKRKRNEVAILRLHQARERLKFGGQHTRDPAWYTASYLLALAESSLHRVQATTVSLWPGKPHHLNALAIYQRLVEDIEQTVAALHRESRFHWWQRLWRCTKRFMSGDDQEIRDEVSPEFLEFMRFRVGFSMARALAEFLGDVRPQEIVNAAEDARFVGLSAREHYNLACYYAQRGAQQRGTDRSASFEKALTALESGLGLPTGAVGDWPLQDDALKPLRTAHADTRARFYTLVATYNGVHHGERAALAELRCIGPTYAELLRQHSIETPEVLAKKTADAKKRAKLAHKLGTTPWLVLRWMEIITLYSITGRQASMVNLLERAGVETRRDLARQDASKLSAELATLNKIESLVETSPDQKTVQTWIDAAQSPTP
ncbi:MAG: DUF4332 domain-containing protein, partial [Chloroflexota bacterium]